jgi:hypothetical protein
MRKLIIPILALGLVASLGACSSSTARGQRGESLTLVEPSNQTLVRGKTNQITLTIDGDQIRGPLEVRFDHLPSGVRIVEENRKIPASATWATFTLYANDDADLVRGNTVTVEIESEDGLVARHFFDLDVVPN